MRSLHLFLLAVLVSIALASIAQAQTPTITNITVKDIKCTYKVGSGKNPCNIAPGMTLIIRGSNFGSAPGIVILCNCAVATPVKWSPTQVVAIVNAVAPNLTLSLETPGGAFSNAVPYNALGPVITSIVVGDCTYVPDQSARLCRITPGTQFTINGSYFGLASNGGSVATCNCDYATIVSWNPDWQTNPSPYNNQIVAVANQAVCGFTVSVFANRLWSNYVAYTAC